MSPITRRQTQALASAKPTFFLPTELRTKILLYLLTSQDPLSLRLKPIPDVYKPVLSNASLAAQFSTLCLVSKQVREEAQKVFFEANEWTLTLHLIRHHPEFDKLSRDERAAALLTPWRRGPEATGTRMNTASLICKHWGEDALLKMKNVKIDVQGEDKDCHADLKAALGEFVGKLERGGSVRRLVVNWFYGYQLPKGPCGTMAVREKQDIRRAERREDGTRENPKHTRIASWGAWERVLEPLLKWKGVDDVRVIGCVTDQWAEELEKSMRSKEEISVSEKI